MLKGLRERRFSRKPTTKVVSAAPTIKSIPRPVGTGEGEEKEGQINAQEGEEKV